MSRSRGRVQPAARVAAAFELGDPIEDRAIEGRQLFGGRVLLHRASDGPSDGPDRNSPPVPSRHADRAVRWSARVSRRGAHRSGRRTAASVPVAGAQTAHRRRSTIDAGGPPRSRSSSASSAVARTLGDAPDGAVRLVRDPAGETERPAPRARRSSGTRRPGRVPDGRVEPRSQPLAVRVTARGLTRPSRDRRPARATRSSRTSSG